jgi:hypothetical protein
MSQKHPNFTKNAKKRPKAVIFIGSRDWIDRQTVSRVLKILKPDLVIEGGADGLDTIVHWEALEQKISVETFEVTKADWKKYGLSAGPRRNKIMLYRLLDLEEEGYEISVCAFPLPESKGTWDMVNKAKAAGVKTRIYKPKARRYPHRKPKSPVNAKKKTSR